jgi:hypothetical protein
MTNKNYNQETEIVQYLFGSQEAVGTVLSSFASSYNRQQGRFYICSKVLCFYSNTLGFEKKLCIQIPDLISANILRNTSIIIQCQSEQNSIVEDYVFRSFKDRFVVLECICKVYYEFTGEHLSQEYHNTEVHALVVHEGQDANVPLEKMTMMKMIPKESILHSEDDGDDDADHDDKEESETTTTYPSIHHHTPTTTTGITKENTSDIPTKLHLDQVALLPIQFHISLKEYHQRFLADDAPKSMTWFQSHCIGDDIQKSTKWEQIHDTDYTRMVHSIHKRNQKFGPSKVLIQRNHTLKWYNPNCIILDTTMTLEGVPYSDCFVIEDEWVITSIHESCVELVVRYRVHFVKKTIMKNIIMKQTREEITKWFHAYLDMLQNDLGERSEVKTMEDEKKIVRSSSNGILWNWSIVFGLIIGLILVLVFGCLIYEIQSLQTEIRQLSQSQRDTLIALQVVKEHLHQSILKELDSSSNRILCDVHNDMYPTDGTFPWLHPRQEKNVITTKVAGAIS